MKITLLIYFREIGHHMEHLLQEYELINICNFMYVELYFKKKHEIKTTYNRWDYSACYCNSILCDE